MYEERVSRQPLQPFDKEKQGGEIAAPMEGAKRYHAGLFRDRKKFVNKQEMQEPM
jgi:hypothetical protein